MNQKSTASSQVAAAYPLDRAQDVMLSKEDLAARLNVAVRTIENWQQKHYLPTIKVEHLVMFYWPTVVLHLHTHFSLSPRGVVKPSSVLAESWRTATVQNLKT